MNLKTYIIYILAMVTININNKHTLTFTLENTFKDVREQIRKVLNTKNKLRINIILDKPLRAFGKLNLEPGILSPMLSAAKLSRFNIKDTLNFTVSITDELYSDDRKPKQQSSNTGLYEIKSSRHKKKDNIMEKEYIYKEDDFPPLG